MKKITSIILASLLALSATASAFATEVPDSDSKEITATYYQPIPNSVYELDIVWGSMEFDYNSGLKRVWNPDTLQYSYEVETEPNWTPSNENGDIVKVNNHSNDIVKVNVAYTKDAENGVDGTLTNDNYILESAEDTAVEDAPSASTQLTLSTENMPNSFKEDSTNVTVGTLTVTLVTHLAIIDATEMTADELNATVSQELEKGITVLDLTLPADASADKFTAIRRALVDTERVEAGSIDLTVVGATTVNSYALNGCSALATVSMPDATIIGSGAFIACGNLVSANFPKATSLGDMSLTSTALTSLILLAEEDISIHEDALGYPNTFSTRVDLILNSNKQADVTGAVWNGFTFASISFLCSDGTNNHNYGTAVSNNNNSHSYTCSICGGTKNESCYGEVTCMELATCEACGVKYGELSEHIINPATGYCEFGCGKFMATAKVTNDETTTYYETVDASHRSGKQNGATITLLKNVVGNKSEYFDWSCDYTFDLNGYNFDRDGYELYVSGEDSEVSLVNTAETRAGIVSIFTHTNAEKFTVGSNVDIQTILVDETSNGILVDISNADFASTTIRIDGSGFNVSQINLGNYAVYDASGNVVTGELTSGTTYTIK